MNDKFLDRMDCELTGWSEPAARLHSALDNDELTLYCQPIRALAGPVRYPMAEVLVRMRTEEHALLPPGEFLPVFEHFRMMPQLDRWVVRTLAKRVQLGSSIGRYSVNLSSQTLEDPDFADFVADQVCATGIEPGALMFEIDEADLLSRPRAAEQVAAALKETGSGILIDGFGRRAASFAPLKTMRVDFIKVDGSITRRVLASASAEKKMKAMVHVGRALGIGLIAECVEDEDILTCLIALGVGHAQGFGICRPQPLDAIASSEHADLDFPLSALPHGRPTHAQAG